MKKFDMKNHFDSLWRGKICRRGSGFARRRVYGGNTFCFGNVQCHAAQRH